MAGTPEKILDYLLETMRPDSMLSDLVDTFLGDFLLTHNVFMPTPQLCRILLQHFHAEPSEGTEQDKAAYILNKRQKILWLVDYWVSFYGHLLQSESSTMTFLQSLTDFVAQDARLGSLLREQMQDRRRNRL